MGSTLPIRANKASAGGQFHTSKTTYLCCYYDGLSPASIPIGTPLMVDFAEIGGVIEPVVRTPRVGADQPAVIVVAMQTIMAAGYYWFACEGEVTARVTYSASIRAGATLKLVAGATAFSYDGRALDDSTVAVAPRAMKSTETTLAINLPGNSYVIPAA